MADFVLSCCSTADLTKEHFQQRDISYICFHYQLDGVDYPDDLGESMPFDKFYAAMANGADTRTSQVNISEFVDYFTPFLEQGKDILHVCLSSGLSGVSNSAENAARIVRERYPERKIYIVDSLGAAQMAAARPPCSSVRRTSVSTAGDLARFVVPGMPPGSTTSSGGAASSSGSVRSHVTGTPCAPTTVCASSTETVYVSRPARRRISSVIRPSHSSRPSANSR